MMYMTISSNGKKGLGSIRKSMTGYARKIPQAGRAGVWNFAQHLAKELREAAPRGFTGRMKSTKGTYAQKINKNEYVVKMPGYTKYLETGVRPKAPPSLRKHPRLAGWARMHGINPYKLKWHIYKEGTKAHPFTARVINTEVKKLKEQVEKEINRTIKKVAR